MPDTIIKLDYSGKRHAQAEQARVMDSGHKVAITMCGRKVTGITGWTASIEGVDCERCVASLRKEREGRRMKEEEIREGLADAFDSGTIRQTFDRETKMNETLTGASIVAAADSLDKQFLDPNDDLLSPVGRTNLQIVIDAAKRYAANWAIDKDMG